MNPSTQSRPCQPQAAGLALALPSALQRASHTGLEGSSPSLPLIQALQQAWPALAGKEEALLALAAEGRSHRIRQRGCLFRDGAVNLEGSLWLLVRGKLSMGRRDAKGIWRQSRALLGGQWIDLVTAWSQADFPETALALSPVLAHEIPAKTVLGLCRTQPALLAALLDSLSRSACEAMESHQALATQDFPSRLAEWLLHELMLQGQGDCLTLSQFKRDLAAQLGVTPETLSRTLREFHEQGLSVMKHSQLRFPDPARLAALSQRQASAPMS